jgi:hypothetical protein
MQPSVKSIPHLPELRLQLGLIDGSDNTLPDSLFKTSRDKCIYVDEMEVEELAKIPEFEAFHSRVCELDSDLRKIIFHIVGGNPAGYIKLIDACLGMERNALYTAIERYLIRLQDQAIAIRAESLLSHLTVGEIYELFVDNDKIPLTTPSVQAIPRPSLDKVLRVIIIGGVSYLVPSTSVMRRFILCHDCKTPHTVASTKYDLSYHHHPFLE